MRVRILAATLAVGMLPGGIAEAGRSLPATRLEALSCHQLARHERQLFSTYRALRRTAFSRPATHGKARGTYAMSAPVGRAAPAGHGSTSVSFHVGLTILPRNGASAALAASDNVLATRASVAAPMRVFRREQAKVRKALWRKGCLIVRPFNRKPARPLG